MQVHKDKLAHLVNLVARLICNHLEECCIAQAKNWDIIVLRKHAVIGFRRLPELSRVANWVKGHIALQRRVMLVAEEGKEGKDFTKLASCWLTFWLQHLQPPHSHRQRLAATQLPGAAPVEAPAGGQFNITCDAALALTAYTTVLEYQLSCRLLQPAIPAAKAAQTGASEGK